MHAVELNSSSTTADACATVETDTPARRLNWPLHAVFAIVFAAFLFIYARTFASLVYTWSHSGTYQYAFLIFPVCAVLVWLRRDWLGLVTGAPRLRGLVGVLGLCLLWLLGAVADINVVQHFSVVALVGMLIYSIYGPAVTRVLVFPLAYMFFAVPFGDFMVGPLQDITAHLSVFALQLTDLPVFMSGRIILTPASTWHVAEACSGVKFFIATAAFGVLYANLFFQRLRRRLIFVLLALIVPVVANGLRVFFTILIGETFGVEYATGTDHLIFGWQFFGSVLVLLFLAGWPWHEPEPAASVESLDDPGPTHGVSTGARIVGFAVLGIASLALAPGWVSLARVLTPDSAAAPAPVFPTTLAGMPRRDGTAVGRNPGMVFANADARATATYGSGPDAVRLDYARYDGPSRTGHELITMGNHVFDPTAWAVDTRQSVTQPPQAAGMMELTLTQRQGDDQWRVWYAYVVNGRLLTSPLMVKAWQAWAGLRAAPLYSAVIVLSTPVGDGDQARVRLQQVAPEALAMLTPTARQPQ